MGYLRKSGERSRCSSIPRRPRPDPCRSLRAATLATDSVTPFGSLKACRVRALRFFARDHGAEDVEKLGVRNMRTNLILRMLGIPYTFV